MKYKVEVWKAVEWKRVATGWNGIFDTFPVTQPVATRFELVKTKIFTRRWVAWEYAVRFAGPNLYANVLEVQ